MNIKPKPLRMCFATHEKLAKTALIRIVKDKDGHIFIDSSTKANGHGLYIKKDEAVITLARQKHLLDKALGVKIDDAFYEDLIKEINRQEGDINDECDGICSRC